MIRILSAEVISLGMNADQTGYDGRVRLHYRTDDEGAIFTAEVSSSVPGTVSLARNVVEAALISKAVGHVCDGLRRIDNNAVNIFRELRTREEAISGVIEPETRKAGLFGVIGLSALSARLRTQGDKFQAA